MKDSILELIKFKFRDFKSGTYKGFNSGTGKNTRKRVKNDRKGGEFSKNNGASRRWQGEAPLLSKQVSALYVFPQTATGAK